MDISKNKVKWCPLCDQRWVQIVKEIETQKLYLCCKECETEWIDPNNIEENTCLAFNSFGKYTLPDEKEIEEIKWCKYLVA